MKKETYRKIATCPAKRLYIVDMIAKCFYDTPNKAGYDLENGTVTMSGKVLDNWRVVLKGNRVRLEFKVGE